MGDLQAKTPCAGLSLPMTIGAVVLKEIDPGSLTTVAPFAGQRQALSELLEATHGVVFPEPNTTAQSDAGQILWFGRNMALLVGPAPDARLADHAALTDQSDAWAAISLEGSSLKDVLARLVPVNMRSDTFETGDTMRTLLGHMSVSITRKADTEVMILVFRSMAETAVDEIRDAMKAVAARS